MDQDAACKAESGTMKAISAPFRTPCVDQDAGRMKAIIAPFRAPCVDQDARSQGEPTSPKPVGEGVGPVDALEFFLNKMENLSLQVFPDIPEPSTDKSLWETPDEVPAAPSEDFTSLFGFTMQAASPTPKSLERKKYRPPEHDDKPVATRGRSREPRMCYDTEGNAVTHTTPKLRPLGASMGRKSMAARPILCSDVTVRVDNASKATAKKSHARTSLAKSDKTGEIRTPPEPLKTNQIRKAPLRSLGKKSTSLPILLSDRTKRLDSSRYRRIEQTTAFLLKMSENKMPRNSGASKLVGRRRRSRAQSPSKRRTFTKSASSPQVTTKQFVSASAKGHVLIEI